jgi:pimeloyl-ACP methyl ester carboxylesterase
MSPVQTKDLIVEVTQDGPDGGPAVLLLHGWPDDATTWDRVSAYLHSAGLRTIAPMHRGFGDTRFLSERTRRTGNTGILCLDAIELMDALGIRRFFVAGHDRVSNVAKGLAVGWPERVTRTMLSTPSRLGGLATPPFDIAPLYWYHWFQTTKRGAEAVAKTPRGSLASCRRRGLHPGGPTMRCSAVWPLRSPNPDWTAVTIHAYRSRWGETAFDPRSTKLEAAIKATKRLMTPTVFFHGALDGVTPPRITETMAQTFVRRFERIVIDGAGHFLPREAPEVIGPKLIEHFMDGRCVSIKNRPMSTGAPPFAAVSYVLAHAWAQAVSDVLNSVTVADGAPFSILHDDRSPEKSAAAVALSQRSVRTRRQPELADDNDPLSPSMNTRVMR